MNVIRMPLELGFIADPVFPKPTLPEGQFPAFLPGCALGVEGIRSTLLTHQPFYDAPADGKVGVIDRQRPDAVQVIGQEYPRINCKRMVAPHQSYGVTQRIPHRFKRQQGVDG